ncbi:MAG: sugar phosphate nucleotidyltransferase [Exilispira sp.]
MKVILLSGGFGKRLFPLSRQYYPKQYIPIFNGKSLFELTIDRFNEENEIFVLTNKISLSFLENFRKGYKKDFKTIYEPFSKNTAVSIEYALQFFEDEDTIGVFPVDHLINDIKNFQNCISKAITLTDDSIVLIGIEPKKIETRFGYIEYNDNNVISFREKPDFELAKKYYESKRFLFNSGIYIFKKRIMQEQIQKFAGQIYDIGNQIGKLLKEKNLKIENSFYPDIKIENLFQKFPSISIDYAVIEKTDKLKVVKGEFDWNDLGNIDSLTNTLSNSISSDFGSSKKFHEISFFQIFDNDKNIDRNITKAETVDDNSNGKIFNDSDNNFCGNKIIGLNGKIYGIIGYSDCKIIDTEDVLLLIKDGYSDNIDKFYKWIENDTKKADTTKYHKTVLKPWGYFKDLYMNNNYSEDNDKYDEKNSCYKIKIIKINKGEQISLQIHKYREEYWTIIEGNGKVIIEDKEYYAEKGKQFFIPKNIRHQAIASKESELVFVEVQIGQIISEEDIIRLKDIYNR